jgi:hypothetical protein
MSPITGTPSAASTSTSGPPTAAAAGQKHPPVLITEQQIAFSTAAAVSVGSGRRGRLHTALMARLGRILSALEQPGPHYPRREPTYFEAARMSREMDRL